MFLEVILCFVDGLVFRLVYLLDSGALADGFVFPFCSVFENGFLDGRDSDPLLLVHQPPDYLAGFWVFFNQDYLLRLARLLDRLYCCGCDNLDWLDLLNLSSSLALSLGHGSHLDLELVSCCVLLAHSKQLLAGKPSSLTLRHGTPSLNELRVGKFCLNLILTHLLELFLRQRDLLLLSDYTRLLLYLLDEWLFVFFNRSIRFLSLGLLHLAGEEESKRILIFLL